MPVIDAPGASLLDRGGLEGRILDAGIRCISRWGVAKTSLDDVAREAGCSRASVYRAFPGGKDSVFTAMATREVERFFAAVALRLERADDVEELLVAGVTDASRRIRDHPALQFLLAHEPGTVVAQPGTPRMASVVAVASAFATSHLERFLPPDRARPVAELVVRLVVSYLSFPSDQVDPSEEAAARDLVRRFVLPVVAAPTRPK